MDWWPFSKTYRHKCPDGSVKVVYRNVDDAFPLFIPGWQAKVGADVKIPQTGQGGVQADYATKIQGLLYGLDELNQSLMMKFRGAYVTYQSDPCANGNAFQQQINAILEGQHKLTAVKTQMQALIHLAELNPTSPEVFNIYKDIVRQIGNFAAAPAATLEIEESRAIAKKWIGGQNDG